MGDRETIEKIFVIMRRLLLVRIDGLNPIPRKGTTRRECYRALYEIQELLETRRLTGKHLPQTNADRIRSMTDEEMADYLICDIEAEAVRRTGRMLTSGEIDRAVADCIDWLKQEVET